MSLLPCQFFFASKTILHVISDCPEQSTPGSIQYRNSYTVNFWRDLFICQHHSLAPVLGDELCSFVNNCPLLRGAPWSRAWMVAGTPPLHSCWYVLSLPVTYRSFFPRFGICCSKAHPENTDVHLTTGRSMCVVLFFSQMDHKTYTLSLKS